LREPCSLLYSVALKAENDTYGDIIILKNVTGRTTVFTLEMFNYIEHNIKRYKYVAKLDPNTFINIKDFWNIYLNQTVQDLNYALISLYGRTSQEVSLPKSGFKALSWKLMLNLNRLYEAVDVITDVDNVQIRLYLYDAGIDFKEVELISETSKRWPVKKVPNDTLVLYGLKDEKEYILVANCFNSSGVNTHYINFMESRNWDDSLLYF
jgi:hypothetical protein